MKKRVVDVKPGDVIVNFVEGPRQVRKLHYLKDNGRVQITLMDGSKLVRGQFDEVEVQDGQA